MHGEKSKWELYTSAARRFEQILETAPNKTVAVRPLTSYLKNHTS